MQFTFSKLVIIVTMAMTATAAPASEAPIAVLTIATGPNLTGATDTFTDTIPLNGACHNFPAGFQDVISSARTTSVARCGLFTDVNCSGQEFFIVPSTTVNLAAPFNNALFILLRQYLKGLIWILRSISRCL
ncbi:hypothetical protein C8J56DRAFT_888035 [Mycena floridula]|nr:hypothetical protein C8J56DRAFT_888035 [Mycena floridula]